MAQNPLSTSIARPLLLLVVFAVAPEAVAQRPGKEPATVGEAARVLDLRTFPLLEGATVHMRSLGILVYVGKGSPQEAFDFQRRELTKRGFQELPGRNR